MIPDEILASLPTPCLVVDWAAAKRNIDFAARYFAEGRVRLRPHFKAHKISRLMLRQLAAGGCSGATCQTTWEALVLARAGVSDVLVSNQIVDRFTLAELAEAARLTRVTVAVDHVRHVELLARLVAEAKVELAVVIELDVGVGRCGLPADSADLVPLAQAIERSQGLAFRGLQAYEGHAVMREDRTLRGTLVWQAARQAAHERDRLAAAGFACEIVSGGGTGTYDLTAEDGVHTEIQAGSYALMDATYASIGLPFEPALYCAASVISRREPRAGVLNAGLKEMSVEYGTPRPSRPDIAVVAVSDEHARVMLAADSALSIGDVVTLIPSHVDPTVNLHSAVFVFDPVAGIERWEVDGRRQVR